MNMFLGATLAYFRVFQNQPTLSPGLQQSTAGVVLLRLTKYSQFLYHEVNKYGFYPVGS